jgi:hypothetical protein
MKASRKSLYGRIRGNAFEQLAAMIARGKRFTLRTLCPRSGKFLTILPLFVGASMLSRAPLQAQVSVLTSQNDNNRSGQNIQEPFLNSINVRSATFAKLGSYSVDGFVVGQPLYMPNVSIPGTGQRNVVFVADQHDSVYAFDADNPSSGTPLWQISLINPAAGVTTVPISEQGCAAVNGYTEVGIQGTPVIDATTNTLYLDAKTKEVVNGVTSYVHRLHALDISTGAEKFGGPAQITGSVQGSRGTVTFDSLKSCQRPGLLLEDGIVYIAYGSNGCDTTHGWVFAYNATTLAQLGVFNTSPNQIKGATVWQGGAGLAADNSGNVYFITANGTFDANTGGSDFGDSFMKLSLGSGGLTWSDYFTPYDQANMGTNDLDLGSGGVLLLPDQPTSPPHLAIGAGKTGTIYLINRDNLGHFQPNNNNQIVQWLQNVLGEVEGTPAYWNGTVYFAPVHSSVVAYSLTNGFLSTQPIAQSLAITPIGAPAISANGGSNGIVWLIRQSGTSSAMLSAFDAVKLTELYNTVQVSGRDSLGATAHFATPTIANGKAYVGTQTQLVIYGLLPLLSPVSGANQTGAAGTTLTVPLTVQAVNPYTGVAISGVPVTFSDGGKNGSFGTPTATTDSTGQASTAYTMPKTFTKFTITITGTSPGYASATFVETVTAGSPASVTLVSGGSQTGTVATMLSAPIVVKVTDSYGNAVPGVPVSFSDGSFGGTFSNNPVMTDSLGRASVSYTLPTKAGYITITASTGSLSSKNITEHAVAASPSAVSIVSGNNQSAKPNTLLPKSLSVSVKDQYGNAVAGVTVSFSDNGAGGTFSSATAITNASGQASVQYTTPPQSGTVTINGSVLGLTPVAFTETVL